MPGPHTGQRDGCVTADRGGGRHLEQLLINALLDGVNFPRALQRPATVSGVLWPRACATHLILPHPVGILLLLHLAPHCLALLLPLSLHRQLACRATA